MVFTERRMDGTLTRESRHSIEGHFSLWEKDRHIIGRRERKKEGGGGDPEGNCPRGAGAKGRRETGRQTDRALAHTLSAVTGSPAQH